MYIQKFFIKYIIVTSAKGNERKYNLEETSITSGDNTLKIDISKLTKVITFISWRITATEIKTNVWQYQK